MMKLIAAVVIASLLPSLALAQPLSQPKPGLAPAAPARTAIRRQARSAYPARAAQDAIPLPPNRSCPRGSTRSGGYCLSSGSRR